MQIGVFQVDLQLPKLPMGFLTTLDHITHIVYAKMAKQLNKQKPLTLPKIRQLILAYTGVFFAHTGQKRCAAAADLVQGEVEGGESKGEGQKHGLEDADLGLFYAGVRHFFSPANKVFFGVVKTRKGRRKFVYFFSAKNEV